MASGEAAEGQQEVLLADASALEALQALRAASLVLQEEWREGSDVQTWKRVKWSEDGEVSEL